MEYGGALHRVSQGKYQVPHGIYHWCFFRAKLLDQEEVRQQLYQREELMTAQQFKAFVEGHFRLDTYGPNFCRSCRRGNRNRRVQRNNIQRTLNAMYAYYKALMHPKGPLCVQPTGWARVGLVLAG